MFIVVFNTVLHTKAFCTGEDEVSFSRHVKALQAEFKKARPNQAVVSELMSSSFSLRRKDIIENPRDLKSILDKYPFLGKTDEVGFKYIGCIYMYM